MYYHVLEVMATNIETVLRHKHGQFFPDLCIVPVLYFPICSLQVCLLLTHHLRGRDLRASLLGIRRTKGAALNGRCFSVKTTPYVRLKPDIKTLAQYGSIKSLLLTSPCELHQGKLWKPDGWFKTNMSSS